MNDKKMMSDDKLFEPADIRAKHKRLLMVSLIINVFFIGGLLGGAYHLLWADHGVAGQKNGQRGLRFAAENLSDEQQERFRDTIRETRRDARPIIKAGIEARYEMRKLLKEPTFNREALVAEIAHVRESDVALRMRLEESMVDFAATLSPEERSKFADGLANRGPLREKMIQLN